MKDLTSMNDKKTFQYHISKYFTRYLHAERNVSPNTIASYADTFKLFLNYFETVLKKRTDKIQLDDITKENVTDFLNWLENERNVTISSRNVRLSAIHSFIKYVQAEDPEHVYEYRKILIIKNKKYKTADIPYLSINQIKDILKAPDSTTQQGFRDKVLLTVLYDTAARVDELIHLTFNDVKLDKPATITLNGKGNKIRVVPIMGNTVELLQRYISLIKRSSKYQPSQKYLFLNRSHNVLTRAGISCIINKYVKKVNSKETIINIKVHPHTFRHSKAVHLLESGIELIYIRDFLGHSSVKTTEIYARVCTRNKREALEKAYENITDTCYPDWNDDKNLMNWLNELSNIKK